MINLADPMIRDVFTKYVAWLNSFPEFMNAYKLDAFKDLSQVVFMQGDYAIISAYDGDDGGAATLYVKFIDDNVDAIFQTFDGNASIVYPAPNLVQPEEPNPYPFTRDDFESEDDWCRAKDAFDEDNTR